VGQAGVGMVKISDDNKKMEMDEIVDHEIQELLMEHPDSKERRDAIALWEEVRRQGNALVQSLTLTANRKIPEPKTPEGYRLPTKSEYLLFERMDHERQQLSHLIDKSEGKHKKELLQQYRDHVDKMMETIDNENIYYVRGSNRYIGSKNPL